MNEEATAQELNDQAKKSGRKKPLEAVKKRAGTLLPIVISVIAVFISLLSYINQRSTNQAASMSAEQSYALKASFWVIYKRPSPEVVHSLDALARHLRLYNAFTKELQKGADPAIAHSSFLVTSTNDPGGSVKAILKRLGIPTNKYTAIVIDSTNLGGYTPEPVVENLGSAPLSGVDLIVEARNGSGKVLAQRAVGVGTIPPCSIARVNAAQQAATNLMNTTPDVSRLHGEVFELNNPAIDVASMIFTDDYGIRWVRYQGGTLDRYRGHIRYSSSYEYSGTNSITAVPGCS